LEGLRMDGKRARDCQDAKNWVRYLALRD
jgi:hypothetical protein